MKFLKTAFAILASVLLVGSQPVFALGHNSSSPAPEGCVCCDCKQTDCCVAPPTSAPQPTPAAPVRTVSQSNFQIIATVVSLLLQASEKIADPVSFAPFASLSATDVPLYEWNCSYLI